MNPAGWSLSSGTFRKLDFIFDSTRTRCSSLIRGYLSPQRTCLMTERQIKSRSWQYLLYFLPRFYHVLLSEFRSLKEKYFFTPLRVQSEYSNMFWRVVCLRRAASVECGMTQSENSLSPLSWPATSTARHRSTEVLSQHAGLHLRCDLVAFQVVLLFSFDE